MRLVGCALLGQIFFSFLAKGASMIQELGLPFISISAPSIVSGMSGESEKTLRETFEEAKVRFPFAKVANQLNHES
jgi:SpoVK/Ycf46/Vps4 family AAA+-type ATPase